MRAHAYTKITTTNKVSQWDRIVADKEEE